MDKSCANHPESMALATCKACEKSICLMCVVDEKEGTFCSSDCHTAFASGQVVPKFVAAAAAASPAAEAGGVQKIDSIFDDGPSAPSAPSEELHTPPSDDPMPIVAEGTKWRPTGAQCENHQDTPAVANCDRCSKAVCALCLLEASQGTFCSADCMGATSKQPAAQPAPAERAALQGKPVFTFKNTPPPRQAPKSVVVAAVIVLLAAGAAGAYYGWNSFSIQTPPTNPDPVVNNNPDPVKPDPIKPDPIKPDPVKPDPIKPDPVKPPVTNTDPQPTYYVPVRKTPKVVASKLRAVNPWANEEPGTWYRMRTVRGNQTTYTDIGLKEKGKDYYVLVTQSSTNGSAAPATETKTQVSTVYLRGEEAFTYEGQEFLCEIRSPGLEENSPKTWALLAGKNQGAIIKSISPEGSFTANRVWEHTIRVKGNPYDCLVLEGQIQNSAGSKPVKIWYSGLVPVGVLQKEAEGESLALIDTGSDWSKRPAFPK